jgi:hypothetical protein
MPADVMGQLLERLRALEDKVSKLEARERNIDYLVLRDGIAAPGSVTGRAIVYIDQADGDLKILYGDAVNHTIDADT